MTNGLQYKGYTGSAALDFERKVAHGRVQFIDDLVTFESPTIEGLEQEFRAAVDDYLETCAQLGREPKKAYNGVFNVRTQPDKHQQLAALAAARGVSLNAILNKAIDMLLGNDSREADIVPPRQVSDWKARTAAASDRITIEDVNVMHLFGRGSVAAGAVVGAKLAIAQPVGVVESGTLVSHAIHEATPAYSSAVLDSYSVIYGQAALSAATAAAMRNPATGSKKDELERKRSSRTKSVSGRGSPGTSTKPSAWKPH